MRGRFVLAWIAGICVCGANAHAQRTAPTGSGPSGVAPATRDSRTAAKVNAKKVLDWREGLSPGRKPQDAPKELKELVGIYRNGENKQIILLEWVQALRMQGGPGFGGTLELQPDGKWRMKITRNYEIDMTVERDGSGRVVALNLSHDLGRYLRADAGSDPASFYHVTPVKPLEKLRAEALAAKPPVEKGPFRKTELLELTALDPGFHLDVRYASVNNFLSTPVYEHGAHMDLQKQQEENLVRVLQKLKPMGYGLLIHDAYRPWYVTKIFWDATPVEGHIFVADPQKGSKHNRGCAVDLTLYDLASGATVEMPGLYDEMSERSFPNFPGGTWLQRWQRDLLRKAMESEGFTVNENEGWDFDYKDWKKYPILNVTFDKVGKSERATAPGKTEEKPL